MSLPDAAAVTERLGRMGQASARLSRRAGARSARRLRQRLFFIAQCSLAAMCAFTIAHYVFDVPVPLFAPVAAIVALGMTHGQRLRRALEITIGVAVGAFIGEAFVQLFGIGPWQILLIVACAMTIATLLGAGTLMANQAGIQGMIVALLSAAPGAAFGRWFEALLGAFTALVFAAVVPSSALAKPRRHASQLFARVAELLFDTADALVTGDAGAAEDVLESARSTEKQLAALRGYAADSVDLLRIAPFHRDRRTEVRATAALLEPMDRAIRNIRVLIRRASIALQNGEVVPDSYVDAMEALEAALDLIAAQLASGEPLDTSADQLLAVAPRTRDSEPGASLSAEVMRAQVRSVVVDLLQAVGRDFETAQSEVQGVLGQVVDEAPEDGQNP